jgi:parallel beta-helix repeat protein
LPVTAWPLQTSYLVGSFPPVKRLATRTRRSDTRSGPEKRKVFQLEMMEERQLLSTITVNTTNDDDTIGATLTLRQAIEISNGTLDVASLSPAQQALVNGALAGPNGQNVIDFAIPGAGPHVILVGSSLGPDSGQPLPPIFSPVVIDGYSQNGASMNSLTVGDNANIQVVLDGFDVDTGIQAAGLTIAGSALNTAGSVVQGLSVVNFLLDGIDVLDASNNVNVIQGNFIGLTPAGLAGPNRQSGVQVEGTATFVGGATPAARNVISGNVGDGILVDNNAYSGSPNILARNTVQGNYIGSDLAGTGFPSPRPNGAGVVINNSNGNSLVGNLISGNNGDGVDLNSTSSNTIQGNVIGANATVTNTMPNASGIVINTSELNVIGGPGAGAGNVISGNASFGVEINGPGPTNQGNTIQGNSIGTDPTGKLSLPNGQQGVYITGSSENLIGGLNPGDGNTIALNGSEGVNVEGSEAGTAVGNAILSNSIYQNGINGAITLTNGANHSQLAPVISQAIYSGGNLIISGTVTNPSRVSFNYTIQVFASSGYQSANVTLATLPEITVPPFSIGTFQATIAVNPSTFVGPTAYGFVNATATDQINDTSPLSVQVPVATPGEFNFSASTYTTTQSGGSLTVTVNRLNGSTGTATVNFATGGGTAVPGTDYVPNSGTLTFPPGVTSQTFSVTILNNLLLGSSKSLGLTLSVPGGGATLGPQSTALATIMNTNSLVVTNTNDSGPGSLRQAILTAEANPVPSTGPNTISFAIPGPGPHVIQVGSSLGPDAGQPLPAIVSPVVINGYSQNGASMNSLRDGDNANIQVVLDGTDARSAIGATTESGLTLVGSALNTLGSVVQGLSVVNFSGDGINVVDASNNVNMIQGDFIGLTPAGVAGANGGSGIHIAATDTSVGGTTPAARNVISGNNDDGVLIDDNNGISGTPVIATRNKVQGNYIGTNASGTAAVPNGLDGILLINAAMNAITGNLLSGNGANNNEAAGVDIRGAQATGNTVSDNKIGVDISGNQALGNSLHGVFVGEGASFNVIGPRNVISGNGGPTVQGVGVYIDGTTPPGTATRSNSIIGNFIGTNLTGTAAISGSSIGVLISNSASNSVGGPNAGDGNVISGNSEIGVYIAVSGATGNVVSNNFIGTDVNGFLGIPNGVDGIFINGAPGNLIGGTAARTGNVISANGSAGIQIFGAGATGNRIFRNRIGLNANDGRTLLNRLTGIFSQSPLLANNFGFNNANQNLGQVAPWQSPRSISSDGTILARTSVRAVSARRKIRHVRQLSKQHHEIAARKTLIATAAHGHPHAKLALKLSRRPQA